MLKVLVPEKKDWYNERTGEFLSFPKVEFTVEHSLVSISKWESKWKKPFLIEDGHSTLEMIDYFRCMTITQHVPPDAYLRIPLKEQKRILDYIGETRSATTIHDDRPVSRKKVVLTSEYIYYMMFEYGIPMECEKWHLSRLLMLIQIFNVKNDGQNKRSKKEQMAYNRELNLARRAKYGSKG